VPVGPSRPTAAARGRALRCRTPMDPGDAGSAAGHRALGSGFPAGAAAAVRSQRAPAQTRSPVDAAAPSPRRRARSQISPFHAPPTCKAWPQPSPVPTSRHVPAGTGAEPPQLLRAAAPAQQTQRDGSRGISVATQKPLTPPPGPTFLGEQRGAIFLPGGSRHCWERSGGDKPLCARHKCLSSLSFTVLPT